MTENYDKTLYNSLIAAAGDDKKEDTSTSNKFFGGHLSFFKNKIVCRSKQKRHALQSNPQPPFSMP